jgi:hypothetical protein
MSLPRPRHIVVVVLAAGLINFFLADVFVERESAGIRSRANAWLGTVAGSETPADHQRPGPMRPEGRARSEITSLIHSRPT